MIFDPIRRATFKDFQDIIKQEGPLPGGVLLQKLSRTRCYNPTHGRKWLYAFIREGLVWVDGRGLVHLEDSDDGRQEMRV